MSKWLYFLLVMFVVFGLLSSNQWHLLIALFRLQFVSLVPYFYVYFYMYFNFNCSLFFHCLLVSVSNGPVLLPQQPLDNCLPAILTFRSAQYTALPCVSSTFLSARYTAMPCVSSTFRSTQYTAMPCVSSTFRSAQYTALPCVSSTFRSAQYTAIPCVSSTFRPAACGLQPADSSLEINSLTWGPLLTQDCGWF